jgi:hypothetical protein
MTLNWKKIRLHLMVLLVLASRASLERLAPGSPSGRIVLISFWLLLGVPLLIYSVVGLLRRQSGAQATPAAR